MTANARIGTALAEREKDNSPRGLIQQYSSDFASVLPSHIKPDTWVRIAQGALKKGKRANDGRFELEVAAANNPAAFLSALLDAARQGLEPGTEQFYLTPRKVKGQLEILGITGYQGHIELIYRAGAVSSVVAEVVREKDEYRYERGVDLKPTHRYPAFAGESTRGPLIGVYAYAVMKDGAISRVVELGQDDIDRIKKSATGANSEYSPWQTNEAAMWLKSSIRQLQKWVPTSPEYLEHQARVAGMAIGGAERERGTTPLRAEVELGAHPNLNREDVYDADVVPDGVDPSTGEIDPSGMDDADKQAQAEYQASVQAQPSGMFGGDDQ
jgi:recombination protein RecT